MSWDVLHSLLAVALPPLLLAYWSLAAGAVLVTLLPVPLPRAFKCACTQIRATPAASPAVAAPRSLSTITSPPHRQGCCSTVFMSRKALARQARCTGTAAGAASCCSLVRHHLSANTASQSSSAAFAPSQDWCVPQAWFLHFYLLGTAANTAALVMYVLSLKGGSGAPGFDEVGKV
jgi:hypothetical protein